MTWFIASQITGTLVLIQNRSHNLFPWWSVSVVTVNNIHSCHSIWSYRSIYRNAQGFFNLNFPCCYWMSPLTSAFIQLKRQDFSFWESATECQTSNGFMKDHLQGTVKLSPILSSLTKDLKIMLPSSRHYSRKGQESMMPSKAFLQKVPQGQYYVWTTQKNIWNPTSSCSKTESSTSALWHHLHHLTGKGELWRMESGADSSNVPKIGK